MIEDHGIRTLHGKNLDAEQLSTANYILGNMPSTALQAGNPSFLNGDMDRLRNLLTTREVPCSTLPHFLDVYELAIEQTMGKASTSINHWMRLYRHNIYATIGTN